MTVATYDELKAAVANWLARSDLSSRIPEFIALAEAEVGRVLRTGDMETRASAGTTPHDPFLALPTGFGGARYLKVTGIDPERSLRFHSPQQIDWMRANEEKGIPQVFAIIGDSFRLTPVPDAVYTVEIAYYRKVPALSDANPTNWLLAGHPDIYLFGTLKEAAPFLRQDERIPIWEAKFANAVRQLETQDVRERYSGSVLAMRTDTGNP